MLRLIWVFAGHTDHFVGFVMRQLSCIFPLFPEANILIANVSCSPNPLIIFILYPKTPGRTSLFVLNGFPCQNRFFACHSGFPLRVYTYIFIWRKKDCIWILGFGFCCLYNHIWAGVWQNQQNDLCVHQRLTSAWASAKSDQSSLSTWRSLGVPSYP